MLDGTMDGPKGDAAFERSWNGTGVGNRNADPAHPTMSASNASRSRSSTRTETSVLAVVLRRRWRLLAISAVVVLVSLAAYPRLPKRFEAAAYVLLRPTDQDGQSTTDQSARNALDENGIQSEIDLLQSRTLGRVVIRRHSLVDDPEFTPPQPQNSWIERQYQAVLEATQRVLIVFRVDAAALGLAPEPTSKEPVPVAEQEVERRLSNHLSIQRDRRSYVLRVSYWSADPAKAAALTNTLTTAYIEEQVARKRRLQANITAGLERRVADLLQTYTASERVVHTFMAETGLIHGAEQVSLQQQLTTLSSEAALAHARAAEAQVRARTLIEMQRTGALESAPEVMASQFGERLKERIATLTAGVGGGSAGGPMSAPQSAINELRQAATAEAQRILRSVQANATVMEQHEYALRAEITRIDTELTRRQEAEHQLDALRRQATADRTALEEAMVRLRAQVGRTEVLQPDAEIVSASEPPLRPIFPNARMVALGTGLMAVFVPVAYLLPALLRLRRRPQDGSTAGGWGSAT